MLKKGHNLILSFSYLDNHEALNELKSEIRYYSRSPPPSVHRLHPIPPPIFKSQKKFNGKAFYFVVMQPRAFKELLKSQFYLTGISSACAPPFHRRLPNTAAFSAVPRSALLGLCYWDDCIILVYCITLVLVTDAVTLTGSCQRKTDAVGWFVTTYTQRTYTTHDVRARGNEDFRSNVQKHC